MFCAMRPTVYGEPTSAGSTLSPHAKKPSTSKKKRHPGKSDAAYTDRCNGLCRAENAMDHFLAWQVESPAQLVSPVLRFGQSVQSPKPVVAPLVGLESE